MVVYCDEPGAMKDSLLRQNLNVPGTLPACKMLNLLQTTDVRSVAGISIPNCHFAASLGLR
ncbi:MULTISPECIES: hypothetical protein [unclassified Mesorhizobium]|uniref:hypothetical protein n=1 Tax=unclassified Mesorhizobium TaxID=325217 RepID=UPI00112DFA7D|nr:MULTISPECIES: hypothetical protein [unclassified Mesorhizobium]TPK85457.1 hypothetical protein FJ548_16660 [Mesorhizobium sp. B2-4-17]TPK99839.1 hypothetical protein FJ938_23745 [Mesorhizobium sp. B2-4-14]